MSESDNIRVEDHAMVQVHTETIDSLKTVIDDLKDRIHRLEDKYDIMMDITSQIKILSSQLMTIANSVDEIKKDFKLDIKELKDEQKIISAKVDRLEAVSKDIDESNDDKKKMTQDLIKSVLEKLILVLVVLILVALFPQISEWVK